MFVVQSTQEIDLFEKIISSLMHSYYAFKLKLEYQLSSTKILSNHRDFEIMSVKYYVGAEW